MTDDELRDAGINVEHPMLSERRVGHPVDVRIGDDRVIRSSSGRMQHCFGYYTPSQTFARMRFGELLAESCSGLFKGLTK